MARSVDRNYDHLFKVLLCGDSGVGKTCLISQFTDSTIRKTHITTIGIDFKLKTFTVKGKRIRLQIWDTAGQERFETLTAQYYRRAQGILLVYDITQEQTFANVTKWLRNIEESIDMTTCLSRSMSPWIVPVENMTANAVEDVKLLLVGNKVDLEEHRQVTTHRGQKLAKQYKIKFFETSAWTDVNIVEAFTALTEEILTDVKRKIQGERVEEGGARRNIVLGTGQSVENIADKVTSAGGGGGGGGGGGWCCSS